MKRLFQLVALATLGLSLYSCDKSDPLNHGGTNPSTKVTSELTEPQRFEMRSMLGPIAVETLSSNTDNTADISEEELRASLYFKGLNEAATTTLKADDFGAGKREARWGVIYDGGKYHAENCDEAVSVEPNDPLNNTVYFKETTTNNTIEGAGIKMYCRSLTTLDDITKGIMLLEGKGGTGSDKTKQYFKGDTDPNHRLEPLFTNDFQDDRHIPIMTKVEDFAEMKKPLGTNNVKFAPRGSLIGLNIKNRLATDIIITHILVEKGGALDYRGYFDWQTLVDKKASFVPEYATTATTLEFPVYASKTATDIGYTLSKNNTDVPCFYVWGFQNPNELGKNFQVKLRYKIGSSATPEVTRIFNVYAPNSKVATGTKQFDDGYSYNVILTLKPSNTTGGGNGNDWGNGGTLITDPQNPLSYVSVGYALNKAGTAFVPNNYNNDSNTDYNTYTDSDVGLFTWAEAMRLFGFNVPDSDNENKTYSESEIANFRQGGTKVIDGVSYHLPNRAEWQSIIPYWISTEVAIQNHPNILDGVTDDNWATKGEDYKKYTYLWYGKILAIQLVYYKLGSAVDEVRSNISVPSEDKTVQFGDVRITGDQYTSEFISKLEGDKVVAYAKRFIGTPFESAWRYSYGDVSGNKILQIQCILLNANSNVSLPNVIARKAFFEGSTEVVKRYFSTYGCRIPSSPLEVTNSVNNGHFWSSLTNNEAEPKALSLYIGRYGAVSNFKDTRTFGFAVRPFYSN